MPTHGSLTKAGKVRKKTPVIERTRTRRRPFPRRRNRSNYLKRVHYQLPESQE